MYIDQAPAALRNLDDAAGHGDVDACVKASHALKSMSLNIGALKVAELVAAMEVLGRDQCVLPSPAQREQLANIFAATVNAIRNCAAAVHGEATASVARCYRGPRRTAGR
jgi:HPt (histidine-containing phosphotransfer) domain-containing protein